MATKITTHYFEFGVHKYFRGSAHAIEPATYGEMNDPVGIKAWLEPAGKVKPEHLDGRLKFNTRVRIDWNTVAKGDLEAEADLNYLGLGKSGMLSFDLSKARSAKLELVNLSIDESPLIRMLNNDANIARNFLAEEGSDGRIVSEVWIVVDAELGEHFATSGAAGVAVKAFGSTAGVVVSGGKHGTQTVQLSSGTTFAYKVHKVSDWNKGKTQVEKVEADYKGLS
ncbi:hypothetical protein HLB44_35785 [Aquincola sp. S2]|uniref:Uncharacterized protein n=1 Tax=Pseudaquabacterium terrae TaxID=2732868 RepID=A0ABX2EUT5_9BURK|nr:hypothetical protein [Aquabacterium terrae]NRF72353.1 hypothetical protein [Aquabacterium terrae]